MKIVYKSGFKYQLAQDYIGKTSIVGYTVDIQFIKLDPDGTLTVRDGYAWDGPSGPTIDDKTNMRGSLEHDAKYQLMRLGLIHESNKNIADEELKERCIEDGMWPIRAWFYFEGVDHFGYYASKYGSEQEPKTAP